MKLEVMVMMKVAVSTFMAQPAVPIHYDPSFAATAIQIPTMGLAIAETSPVSGAVPLVYQAWVVESWCLTHALEMF